ncbi:MAG: sulfotransferase, partial [Chloroflexota bacterium]
QDMYEFLEVEPTFQPDLDVQHNVSGVPQSNLLQLFLSETNIVKRIAKPFVDLVYPPEKRDKMIINLHNKNRVKPDLDPKTKTRLKAEFHDDILKLQSLIDRDLTHWL